MAAHISEQRQKNFREAENNWEGIVSNNRLLRKRLHANAFIFSSASLFPDQP